jgi:hypothetical protein
VYAYVAGGARKKKKTPWPYSLFGKQARQSATIFVVKFTFSLISFFFSPTRSRLLVG